LQPTIFNWCSYYREEESGRDARGRISAKNWLKTSCPIGLSNVPSNTRRTYSIIENGGTTMKKFFSVLLCLTLFVSVTPSVLAEKSEIRSARETKIIALYEERAELINKLSLDQKESEKIQKEIEKIEKQLQANGVEFLHPAEVQQKFSENNGKITPLVVVPVQSNVSWSTYRTAVTYNGQTYDVQRLVAAPNEQNSNLKAKGNRVLQADYDFKAGAMQAAKSVAT
jgi:hypothetical protein